MLPMRPGHRGWRIALRLGVVLATLALTAPNAASAMAAVHHPSPVLRLTDTTAPSVVITSPVNGATVSGSITITGSASDDRRVAAVRVQIDSRFPSRADGTTSWSYALDTTSLTDGAHQITAIARDGVGNSSSVTISVTIDNGSTSSAPPPPPPTTTTTGPRWGLSVNNSAVDPSTIETAMGRPYASRGDYLPLSGVKYPNSYALSAASEGAQIYLNINSWKVVSGVKVCYPWADVASGVDDPLLQNWVNMLKAFNYPNTVISFHHEMNLVGHSNEPQCGTPADYRAAYEHVYEYFRAAGIDYPFVWAPTASAFAQGTAQQWQPPNFDYVGADGYNRDQGGAWRSFDSIFAPAHTYAVALGKPLFIGEVGSVESPTDPTAKAAWFADAVATIKQWGDLATVEWSDSATYQPDSSSTSLASFVAGAQDPYFS